MATVHGLRRSTMRGGNTLRGTPLVRSAPTFVTAGQSVFNNTTTPKTISVTVQAGDILVISGITADSAKTLNTPTGGGLTYTLEQSSTVASNCAVYQWTAVSGSGQTFTLSVSATGAGAQFWGFTYTQWRNSDGVGNSNKINASGAPSLNASGTDVNSSLTVANGDWSAQDGTTRTWRTVNGVTPAAGSGEDLYFRDAAQYATYEARYLNVGSTTSYTVGLSAPGSQTYTILTTEVLGKATGAGLSGNINQALETDSALTFGNEHKQKAVNQASTTDTSQPIGESKRKTLTFPTETDTAQPIGEAKRKTLGQAVETDSSRRLGVPVNRANETDTAQALQGRKSKVLGQATETDLARPVRGPMQRAIETDTAQPLTKLKTKAISQSSTTDLAQPINEAKRKTLGQSSTTDTAQPINEAKSKTLGQALEVDLAQTAARRKQKLLGQAQETSLAQPLKQTTKTINQTTETDTAGAVGRAKRKSIGVSTEVDTSQPINEAKRKTLNIANETDSAQALARIKSRTLGQPVNTNTALTLQNKTKLKALGQAFETDISRPLVQTTKQISQVIETDTSRTLSRFKSRTLNQALDTAIAQSLGRRKTLLLARAQDVHVALGIRPTHPRLLGRALETNLSRPISASRSKIILQVFEVDTAGAFSRFIPFIEPDVILNVEIGNTLVRSDLFDTTVTLSNTNSSVIVLIP